MKEQRIITLQSTKQFKNLFEVGKIMFVRIMHKCILLVQGVKTAFGSDDDCEKRGLKGMGIEIFN